MHFREMYYSYGYELCCGTVGSKQTMQQNPDSRLADLNTGWDVVMESALKNTLLACLSLLHVCAQPLKCISNGNIFDPFCFNIQRLFKNSAEMWRGRRGQHFSLLCSSVYKSKLLFFGLFCFAGFFLFFVGCLANTNMAASWICSKYCYIYFLYFSFLMVRTYSPCDFEYQAMTLNSSQFRANTNTVTPQLLILHYSKHFSCW